MTSNNYTDQHPKSDNLSIYIKRYDSELLINAKQEWSDFDLVFDSFFLIRFKYETNEHF